MFKFLLKLVFFIALIVVIAGLIANKKGLLPGLLKGYVDTQAISKLSKSGLAGLGPQVSGALDSLIVHPNQNSPVVLGLKVSNDSLNTIVDLIQRLPPDKISQLKNTICQPATSSATK